MKPLILVGAFLELIELSEECDREVIGVIDRLENSTFHGVPVIGTDDDVERIKREYRDVELLLSPDSPKVREKLFKFYSKFGFTFATLISPSARISKSAKIGVGSVVQYQAAVSSESCIGDFVKINYGANVTHNCTIGSFSTVAPGAILLGYSTIGISSYIGAASCVLPKMVVGDEVVIGAGAVVTRAIASGKTAIGVPAVMLESKASR